MLRSALLLTSLAAVVSSAAGVTAANAADPITCGDTIATSVRLTADLSCQGNGLTIGASNVTLDLGGHTLHGNGTGTGVGIDSSVTGVRIVHGTVSGFQDGIGNDGSTSGHPQFAVESVLVTNNTGGGVQSPYGGSARILNSRISNNGFGLRALRWNLDVDHSTIASNLGLGILGGADGSVVNITRSTISGNGSAGISATESFLHVSDSRVTDNAGDGILLTVSWGSTVRNSLISGNHGSGISSDESWTFGSFTTAFTGNTFAANEYGIRAVGGRFGGRSFVNDNLFRANRVAGVLMFDFPSGTPNGTVELRRNVFVNNGFASGGAVDLFGRTVNDGLHMVTAAMGAYIAQNVATHNADYGIEASGAATDGGGNIGAGNGNPAQCVGVACRP